MILDYPNLYCCPHCESLISTLNWMSANTFDAILYSDNKAIFPHCPEAPDLTKCHNCNNYLWLSNLRTIELPPNFRKEAESKSKEAEFLSTEDLFKAIETGFIQQDEMFFVRYNIWHSYNDRVRDGNDNIFKDSADEKRWKENLDELKTLFDINDQYHTLLIAEIERNLGNFDDALSLLEKVTRDDLQWTKQQYVEACNNKNIIVFRLKEKSSSNKVVDISEYIED